MTGQNQKQKITSKVLQKNTMQPCAHIKKSDHPKTFGWFGNWTGEGASLVNSMAGIPDSVDVVSIWGNWSNITEAQKKDLKFCQEVKGTRFTMCFIITSVGTQNHSTTYI